MAADDALLCLNHPLEGLVISSRASAIPDSNAAREDAPNGAPVKVFADMPRQGLVKPHNHWHTKH